MRAADLDFSSVQYFSEWEFPSLPRHDGDLSLLKFLDASIVKALSRFRGRLGNRVVLSSASRDWIRESGDKDSAQYIGPIRCNEEGQVESERLGVAASIFPQCDIRLAFLTALGMPEFGSIGICLDTFDEVMPAPMLYLDLRVGTRQIWLRNGAICVYPLQGAQEMDLFFHLLGALSKWKQHA